MQQLPAEGAVGFGFEEFETFLADGVVHAADYEGSTVVSVEFIETDVAFVYCAFKLLAEGVHSLRILFVSGIFIIKM